MPQKNKSRGVVIPTQSQQDKPQGKSWFLGIGINKYMHFPGLNNAVKDVQDILDILQKKYEIDNPITLWDEKATRKEIIKELDRLADEVKPNDKLLIYYSGHGHLNKRGKGFWIPTDAEKDNTAQYIRNSTIKEYIEEIDSKHSLLISDSCFSGSLFVQGKSRTTTAADKLEQRKSRWAICSGRHDEEVYDGNPGINSPFAASILKVLLENDQPKFNTSKLADWVVELTSSRYRQLPMAGRLFEVGDDGGQYIFISKQSEDNIWVSTQTKDSISGYSTYLRQFPSGKYTKQTLQRIKELEDNQAWNIALHKDLLSEYFGYTQRFPNGLHIKEVWKKIEELEKGKENISFPQKNEIEKVAPKIKKVPKKKQASVTHSKFGTFTDPRDDQMYKTVELNGKTWLAENLNYDVGTGCSIYQKPTGFLGFGKKEAIDGYGRLYTWEAAQKACPPGWSLPTDEDWQEMMILFGGYGDDAKDEGKAAYEALIQGGSSRFNIILGGGRHSNGIYYSQEQYGNYWSSTAAGTNYAWHYYFDSSNGKIYRKSYDKLWGFSCRCVQSS